MALNTPEMFNAYKRLDSWNPLTAALTVNGILSDEAFKEMENRQEVHKVFKASLSAFKNGELLCFEEDDQIMSLTPHKRQFLSDFYRDDDVYDHGYVRHFKPIAYVKWMTEAKIIRIPNQLMLTDKKDGWTYPPNPPTLKWNNIPLWKEAHQTKINEYVQYEYWSRIEAISVLFGYDPQNDNLVLDLFDNRRIALEALNRALEIKSIKLDGTDKDRLSPPAFLKWACDREYSIPVEFKSLLQSKIALRPNQKAKKEIQDIGNEIWGKYPVLQIKHLLNYPEIVETGKDYGEQARHRWLSEVATEKAKAPGKRPPEVRAEQKKICQKLGIPFDK